MTNYTADQLALRDLLEAEKARTQAWVAEGEGRWAMWSTTDLDHWAEMGVTSVASYERHNDESYISDSYKEVHGFRPRWINFDIMSDEAVRALAERMDNEAREAQEREGRQHEEEIASMMEHGAPDRETALRWMEAA